MHHIPLGIQENMNTFLCFLSVGLRGSLQRLQLEYVDVVFANRPDSNTPMEGTWGLGPKQEVTSSFASSVMSIIAFWNVFEAIRKAMQALYALRL